MRFRISGRTGRESRARKRRAEMNRRSFISSTGAFAAASQATAQPAGVSSLRLAACQILTFPEPEKSVRKIVTWMEKAAADKVDVVLFPEAALCGYTCEAEYWKKAKRSDFEA